MSSAIGSRIGTAALVVVVGAFVLVYSQMEDYGVFAGTVDLRDGSAVTIRANSEDTLRFPAFVTVDTSTLSGTPEERVERARESMAASTLRVRITSPAGTVHEITCPLWRASASSDTSVAGRLTETRIANDCAYEVEESGAHEIHASVDWAPALSVVEAHVELRNELAP
jgi:hypothetical protein